MSDKAATLDEGLDRLRDHLAGKEPVRCPKCSEPMSIEMVAKAAAQSKLVFSFTPSPGEFMDAETIGGSLGAASKLLKAIGKQIGVKAQVLLSKIETGPNGELRFELMVCRSVLAKGKS